MGPVCTCMGTVLEGLLGLGKGNCKGNMTGQEEGK